ncbi:MAG TPA: cyclase family protein [Chloroflexota bacterium]|jgi:kynurenine formamidase|nr:cyclase family protein [Chloroflexota bacterium]
MAAPVFRYRRVVDLSRRLVPGRSEHPWTRFDTRVESIVADPTSTPAEGRWYVVTQLALSGHAGTHVEAPYHALADGATVGALPVDRWFGQAVVLDLSDAPWSAPVELARLQHAAARAGGIRSGDIVFLRFDWDLRSTANGGYPPYPATEALRWLVDQGIKLLGIDSPGLEVPGDRSLVNHRTLFERGIPLIESLTDLDRLGSSRVYVFAVPPPAVGTDAMPLRVLAFEG